MGLNLPEKTELWVNEITLDNTNLTDLANAVARVLGLFYDSYNLYIFGQLIK